MILAMLQDILNFALVIAFFNRVLGDEFLPSGRFGDAEVFGQPTDIFLGDADSGVAAAVAGTLAAIVFHFSHGTIP